MLQIPQTGVWTTFIHAMIMPKSGSRVISSPADSQLGPNRPEPIVTGTTQP